MKRRTVSGILVAAGSALVAGAVGIPTLIAGISPIWQPLGTKWRRVGTLDRFRPGQVTRAIVEPEADVWPRRFGELAVFVWRPVAAELVVFSQSCTDLGCPLEYEAGSACFLCPCHGGIFAQDGRRLAGPPKTPMLRYAHRLRDDVLEIDVTSLPPAA
jgi:menaquinol-cytochrome c reductase iron-sulfur subunit